MIVLKLLVSF